MDTVFHSSVLIQNKLGLHARAAMKLVELTQRFNATLEVKNEEGKEAQADSIMGLLMLESAQGQSLTLEATGEDAELLLDAAIFLIESKFDEGE